MTLSAEAMAPLMFMGLIVFLLIGYPVAFSLMALGLAFGVLGIEVGSDAARGMAIIAGIGRCRYAWTARCVAGGAPYH
jgi:TRAP-type mannitol/chloroaromatic compound transport system permease large subunit